MRFVIKSKINGKYYQWDSYGIYWVDSTIDASWFPTEKEAKRELQDMSGNVEIVEID